MSFLHQHRPLSTPQPDDLAIVVSGKTLLIGNVSDSSASLPEVAVLGGKMAEPIHLGLLDGLTCWFFDAGESDVPAPAGFVWKEMRPPIPQLTPSQKQALACALTLKWWSEHSRFCGVCGTPTVVDEKECAMRCPKCGALFYPTPSPAVIVAVTKGDKLLLASNKNFPTGRYSVIAGFADPGESLEQTVVREVREEVGIEIENIEYVTSQSWPFPNSLMVGFKATYKSGELKPDGVEIGRADWFARDNLPDIPPIGSIARALIEAWKSEH